VQSSSQIILLRLTYLVPPVRLDTSGSSELSCLQRDRSAAAVAHSSHVMSTRARSLQNAKDRTHTNEN